MTLNAQSSTRIRERKSSVESSSKSALGTASNPSFRAPTIPVAFQDSTRWRCFVFDVKADDVKVEASLRFASLANLAARSASTPRLDPPAVVVVVRLLAHPSSEDTKSINRKRLPFLFFAVVASIRPTSFPLNLIPPGPKNVNADAGAFLVASSHASRVTRVTNSTVNPSRTTRVFTAVFPPCRTSTSTTDSSSSSRINQSSNCFRRLCTNSTHGSHVTRVDGSRPSPRSTPPHSHFAPHSHSACPHAAFTHGSIERVVANAIFRA